MSSDSRRHSRALFVLLFCSIFVAAESAFGQLNVSTQQIDANNFPFIFLVADVTESGNPLGDLTTANFSLTEDGRPQTDYFDVTPPEVGGGVRLVDFVFLIDNSGSMQPEINAVRNNVNAFADLMVANGIDLRLGAVRFGQSAGGGMPQIFNSGNLTGDLSVFHSWINQMYASGGVEPGLLAVQQAATTFNFRPGSQRHFLLITDEQNNGGGTLSGAISACQSNNVVVHVAVDCGYYYPQAYNHYCRPGTSISGATGGLVFSVIGPYNTILDAIGHVIANTYVIRYRTDNPNYDGQQRTVVVQVNAFGQTDTDIAYYTPGAGPRITRTQETVALSSNPPVAGSPLTIAANIVDNVPPGVTSARVYYKAVGQNNYSSVLMNYVSGTLYSGQIPGGAVVYPGINYYLTATDGQLTSSDPPVEPGINPYDIAVLPNVAPVIEHTPVTEAGAGNPIQIAAIVNDNTHNVASVILYYRKTGILIYSSVNMTNTLWDLYIGTIPAEVVTSDGVDYYIRAFDDLGLSTPHGPHSVIVSIADTDGDGLPDVWETNGYDYDDGDGIVHVDLPGMGANPLHKDVFVEIDWMGRHCDPFWPFCHDHRPRQWSLNKIVEAFANAPIDNQDGIRGITLHIDTGDLGGGNEIVHDQELGSMSGEFYQWNDFDQIKQSNFSENRRRIFHYCLYAHDLPYDPRIEGKPGGLSRGAPSTDFIIALDNAGSRIGEASTFMHELGHNLGLNHSGDTREPNYEPNYLSVMNYSFSWYGLIINGKQGNFDYSWVELPELHEATLDETIGLNGGDPISSYTTIYYRKIQGQDDQYEEHQSEANDPIDWNCDGNFQPNTQASINKNANSQEILTGYNDWAHLSYDGGGVLGAAGSIPAELPESTFVDEFTWDDIREMKPVQPRDLATIVELGYIALSWDSVGIEEDSLIRFNVYRGQQQDFQNIQSVFIHTYPDSYAVSGITNVYGIKVENQYGNESEFSNFVEVTTFNFFGFLPPLKNDIEMDYKLNRVIPVKFQLTDSLNVYVRDAHAEIFLQRFQGDTPIGEIIPGTPSGGSNEGNIFRYDNIAEQYIYNLNTEPLSLGKWLIRVLIDDGTTHRIFVNLR